MIESTIITLVGQLGFPIFTAIYFMTRIEKSLTLTNKLLAIVATRLDINLDDVEKKVDK